MAMTSGFNDPRDPAGQLARYLRPGESLLWSGHPDPAVHPDPSDAYLIPFSILWCGFAIFWEASVIASHSTPVFMLFGIPFVGAGLFFVFGRFFYNRRQKLRTIYGLSTERALIAVGDTTLIDAPVRNIPTTVRRSKDGSHVSVIFGESATTSKLTSYGNSGL